MQSLTDRVTQALGHQYKLEAELGRGGMSVVYRARDLRLNRAVAIKVLPPELAHDAAVGSRFTREAQTSAQLAHPNIVPIYDVGERDDIAYFVMALVSGGNLAARIERQPVRPIDEVRRVLSEIADALSYAHLRGVIHRDVKSDNILIDGETGRAMVTDFGIARAVESGNRLTLTGIAVGTPAYMSPEQALGERDLDGRSDVYSLGVLGYQMLTGRMPFTASNSMALLLKHVNERPKPISELRPEAPKSLCDVIERALQKTPADRWATAAAMRDALGSADNGSAAWRSDARDMVRYISPIPRSRREPKRELETPQAPAIVYAPPVANPLEAELPHFAGLTPEQRADLRLWHGQTNLLGRVREMRRYALYTIVMSILGAGGFVFGVEEVPPFVLAPIVPLFMMAKTWKRGRSLRESGIKLWRVFLLPRSRMALPKPSASTAQKLLAKLATPELLNGPRGRVIRRAVDDREAILEIVRGLPKADRALLPEIEPTIDALVERVAHLAARLEGLDADFDPRQVAELDARIASMERDDSPEGQQRLSLLKRQRATLDDLVQRRAALERQIENAGLTLANLRLDLIKLRSSGVDAALGDVSSATQEARILSRDIAMALDAAMELRKL